MRRCVLGIAGRTRPLGKRLVRYHSLPMDQAVEVMSVDPAGPAAKAGLRERDILVRFDGRRIESIDDLHRFLTDHRLGEPATITVVRSKEKIDIEIVPVEAPPD